MRPLPLLLLLTACEGGHGGHFGGTPGGEGLFSRGCPVPGEATARALQDVGERPWGEEGLARPGDVLLMNERAAFVIQGVDDPATYYHYGGGPIDAVTVRDCEQTGPERLEELGFIVGQLDLGDFNQSTLRQVRGESVEIVNDGSDGDPAVVEVHGTDDRFWLVELTLIRNVWNDGGRKELGELYGLDITLRYTLEPDSAALQMDVLLGGEPITDGFLVGAIVFPSDYTSVAQFANGAISVGGFGLDLGVPWLSMSSAEGSLAVAMPGANMAYTSVAGVRAILDSNQALAPLRVAEGAAATPFLLGVGERDSATASAPLEPLLPDALGTVPAPWSDLSGAVDDPDGTVAGAIVTIEAQNDEGDWEPLERLVTDENGAFAARTILPGTAWRATASMDGRDAGTPVELGHGQSAALGIGRAGEVLIEVTDGEGAPMPARVELERADGADTILYTLPGDVLPLAPGSYTAWVSRGYEYDIAEVSVEVPEGGTATLSAALDHLVDTTGWASVDTHVHQSPSADSDTLNELRFRTVVASGLDVMVSTDHEAIIDLAGELSESPTGAWMAYGLGEEVTATIPEHVNGWPFHPNWGDPRGEPVRWYQLGFPELYAAIRAREAAVVQLNHSRVNGECGILCVLDWDRMTDPPATDDPEGLGFPAGTEVWSWDFDSFEVLNDARSPLLDPADPRHTGALVDWLSFTNLGYPKTGVAVTDVHGRELPGEPLTFVRVPDDAAGVVTAEEVADGELAGAAVMSAGAFAEATISGAGPGELSRPGALLVRVEALPPVDVTQLYVLVDCDLVATVEATDPAGVVKFDGEIPLDFAADASVVVLGFGDQDMPRGLSDYDQLNVPRFITNPIFVDADGDGVWTAPGPKECATGVEVGR